MELLRFIAHVPLTVHASIRDTSLGKFPIPKNTLLILSLWDLHHNENIYPDPYSFKPERFLDQNGKIISPGSIERKNLMPFGAGRRVCVGETLAKNRLFLVTSALVQRYKMKTVDGKTKKVDPRTYQYGLVLKPENVNVKMVKRDNFA